MNSKEEHQISDTTLNPIPKPKKAAPAISPTTKHKNDVEKDLISKAHWLVVFIVLALLAVYVFYTFTKASTSMTSDIVAILSAVLTFVLGFLFGSARK